ncbi:UDPGP type 1 family protein [Cryptosporidium felis]|nr:UDPGP type 1 family protein [Cryptosporidium felis]
MGDGKTFVEERLQREAPASGGGLEEGLREREVHGGVREDSGKHGAGPDRREWVRERSGEPGRREALHSAQEDSLGEANGEGGVQQGASRRVGGAGEAERGVREQLRRDRPGDLAPGRFGVFLGAWAGEAEAGQGGGGDYVWRRRLEAGIPGPEGDVSHWEDNLSRICGVRGSESGPPAIPMYIMTSERNDAPIRRYFRDHENFGLKDVSFFKQESVPSISLETGSFFLSADGSILKSPAGNGSLFESMKSQGVIDDMAGKGIEYVFVHCVDNPLCKICDPLFVGYSDLFGTQVSTKTVNKRSQDEKIGSLAQKIPDGRSPRSLPCIVEYSELNQLPEREKDSFSFGSIGIHLFTLQFIRQLSERTSELPFHLALKKVPHLDTKSSPPAFIHDPPETNAIKPELFIFDSFCLASSPVHCLNVSRDEFAPVKSLLGQDSPQTSQLAVSEYNKKLLSRPLPTPDGEPEPNSHSWLFSPNLFLEISPLLSYSGENLQEAPLLREIRDRVQKSQSPRNPSHHFFYVDDSARVIHSTHL